VTQKVGHRDAAGGVGIGVIGEQGGERVVEAQPASLDQLRDRDRGKHLVHRGKIELRVHLVRNPPAPVRQAVGAVEDGAAALRHQDHAGELVPLRRPGKAAADLVQHRGFQQPARRPDVALLDRGVPHRDSAVVTQLLREARIREGPDPRPVIAEPGLDQDLQRLAPFGFEDLESPALLRHAGQPRDTISQRDGFERFLGDVSGDERGLRGTVTGVDRLDQSPAQAADRGCGKDGAAIARDSAHLGGDARTRRCARDYDERETQVRHRVQKTPPGKRKGRSGDRPDQAYQAAPPTASAEQQPQETGGEGNGDVLVEARRQACLGAGELERECVEAAHVAVRPGSR
jgi:hypothetical protein